MTLGLYSQDVLAPHDHNVGLSDIATSPTKSSLLAACNSFFMAVQVIEGPESESIKKHSSYWDMASRDCVRWRIFSIRERRLSDCKIWSDWTQRCVGHNANRNADTNPI
ncbi:hypothetical protein L218DRAFT_95818 [Marasmius fiardii PR-910]|nr:hypothetical protein L218DRAFT_95818 [Marasmius fiardii PR-910]